MKKQFLLAAIVATLCTSCKKTVSLPDTIAGFTLTGDNRAAPTKVTFTNTTSNGLSYTWDFGDGATSSTENVEHVYKNPGSYTVKLTAKGNSTATSTKIIVVKAANTLVNTTYVKVVGIPFTKPGGSGWDSDATGPDVFFKISDGSTIFVDASANRFNDVTSTMLPLQWNFTTPFQQAISKVTKIQVFDYDPITANELIGEIPFAPAYYNNFETWEKAYPASVTIAYNGITVEIGLQWH